MIYTQLYQKQAQKLIKTSYMMSTCNCGSLFYFVEKQSIGAKRPGNKIIASSRTFHVLQLEKINNKSFFKKDD